MKTYLIILGFMICLPVICSGAVIHVPSEQPTIQAGIDAAVEGDTVLVADGIYTGDGNRDIEFYGKAITVMSENGPVKCVVDCEGTDEFNHRGFYFHHFEDENSVVQGFTIKNGFIIGDWHNNGGGGILCEDSTPTITDCIISGNFTDYTGGGINVYSLSAPRITKCQITDNFAQKTGGGINGYSLIVTNCILTKNFAPVGAGIYCNSSNVTNCIFLENSGTIGGGIYSNNSSFVTNCTFSGNSASQRGCGITCYSSSMTNPMKVTNCIFWDKTINEIHIGAGRPVVTYSDVQGGYLGIGNINSDPLFFNDDSFKCHLTPMSPGIDAGTSHGAPGDDLDGNHRPQGGAVDMGAYEYSGWPNLTRVNISMPSHNYESGDVCNCYATVWNAADDMLIDHHLFIVLALYSNYYYAPTFGGFNFYTDNFPIGETTIAVVPEFTWPQGVGSADGIIWYAGLANPQMTELVGEMGVFDFGWSE